MCQNINDIPYVGNYYDCNNNDDTVFWNPICIWTVRRSILFTDDGYNITLQRDNDCNSKQFSETALYYQANEYHKVGNSQVTGLQSMQLTR
jgi:hypothetical protein